VRYRGTSGSLPFFTTVSRLVDKPLRKESICDTTSSAWNARS